MIVSDEQFGASYQIMNVIFVVVAVIGKYPQSDILIEESPMSPLMIIPPLPLRTMSDLSEESNK